jgi:hypothetical protein
MPYRTRFACLWCGDAWTARGPADLEGWALLCPACLGRAGTNTFLRGRLRTALAERAAAGAAPVDTSGPPARAAGAAIASRPAPVMPAFPDEWFLRRGPFEHGPLHDAAWAAELDVVTRWLDARPLSGRILEPAAGVGFFSPLLAQRGELHASDSDAAALDRARERLVAHRLLAHLHVADPWVHPAPAEPPADALLAAFLLGRVRGAGLDPAVATFRSRLRAGGMLAAVDLRPDPAGGPPAGVAWTYHEPGLVEAALGRAGFTAVEVAPTGRFFLTVSATAG